MVTTHFGVPYTPSWEFYKSHLSIISIQYLIILTDAWVDYLVCKILCTIYIRWDIHFSIVLINKMAAQLINLQ